MPVLTRPPPGAPPPGMPPLGMPPPPRPFGVPGGPSGGPLPFFPHGPGGVPTAAHPLGVPTAPTAAPVGPTGKKVGVVREAAGQRWVDPTLLEWPENDFRIFVGSLGNEVTDAVLAAAFQRFPTFQKAKVIRYSHNGKSKGYGFVSFGDQIEGVRVIKEMNGKYVGNRPVQLRKSQTDERTVTDRKGQARMREIKEPKAKKPRTEAPGRRDLSHGWHGRR